MDVYRWKPLPLPPLHVDCIREQAEEDRDHDLHDCVRQPRDLHRAQIPRLRLGRDKAEACLVSFCFLSVF